MSTERDTHFSRSGASPPTLGARMAAALRAQADHLRAQADLWEEWEAVPPSVGIIEAAPKLGYSVAWLERPENWRKVGGYKRPTDGHVRFPLSALAEHARRPVKQRLQRSK
jgi:chloramphenicol O-acetyltransferase